VEKNTYLESMLST